MREVRRQICSSLRSTGLQGFPALLYGSCARGEATADSDVDVLVIGTREFVSIELGRVTISCYPLGLLSSMRDQGALFVQHLAIEAVPLCDNRHIIERLLGRVNGPDFARIATDLRVVGNVLDCNQREYYAEALWLNRVAIYTMRTALFSMALKDNLFTFSMARIAEHFSDPQIVECYQWKYSRQADYFRFCVLRGLVERLLGGRCNNPYGSIDAFVKAERRNPCLRGLAKHRTAPGSVGAIYV